MAQNIACSASACVGNSNGAVLSALSGALSSNAAVRNAAETQLARFEETSLAEFLVHLASIVVNGSVEKSLRKLAAVQLRSRYSVGYGDVADAARSADENSPEYAQLHHMLRGILFRDFLAGSPSDEDPHLCFLVTAAVSCIVRNEWPSRWPDFLPNVIEMLTSGEHLRVLNAAALLEDFVGELVSEDNYDRVYTMVVPPLVASYLSNYSQAAQASMSESAVAPVLEVSSKLSALTAEVLEHIEVCRKNSYIPQDLYDMLRGARNNFVGCAAGILRFNIDSQNDQYIEAVCKAKINALEVLRHACRGLPSARRCELYTEIDPLALHDLIVISKYQPNWDPSDLSAVDSETAPPHARYLVHLLNFTVDSIRSRKRQRNSNISPEFVKRLIYVFVSLGKLPVSALDMWCNDLPRFIEEELLDDSVNTSLRMLCRKSIADLPGAWEILSKLISEAMVAPDANGIVESALALSSSLRASILSPLELVNAVINYLSRSLSPALVVRTLILIGDNARYFKEEEITTVCQITSTMLNTQHAGLLQVVSALYALSALALRVSAPNQIAAEVRDSMMTLALDLAVHSTQQTLVFALNVIRSAISLDYYHPNFGLMCRAVETMVRLINTVARTDSAAAAAITDTAARYADTPLGHERLCSEVAPSFASLISQLESAPESVAAGLAFATRLLERGNSTKDRMLAESEPREVTASKNAYVVDCIYNVLMGRLSHIQGSGAPIDSGMQARAHEFLCTVLAHETKTVTRIDPELQGLMRYAFQALFQIQQAHMKTADDPNNETERQGASHLDKSAKLSGLCRSTCQLIQHVSIIAPGTLRVFFSQLVPVLLAGITTTPTYAEQANYMFVFIQLFLDSSIWDDFVAFLGQANAPTELQPSQNTPQLPSLLWYVVRKWMECHEHITEHYDSLLSTIAMTQLLARNDERLAKITVRGQIQAAPSTAPAVPARRVTRSVAQSLTRETEIPFYARVVQILVCEYISLRSNHTGHDDDDDDNLGSRSDSSESSNSSNESDEDENGYIKQELYGTIGSIDLHASNERTCNIGANGQWIEEIDLEKEITKCLISTVRYDIGGLWSNASAYLPQDHVNVLAKFSQSQN